MARPSCGPEAKKRSLQLFTVLLNYANDELDCDETALDALRPQIQTHWQTEQRLVIRTKVRILESLSKLANAPLTAEQIKESLRRFEDFLEILDDNRPNRGGSEVWHFTLKLWHKRSNCALNLRQFEQEWEHRRPQKSKQVIRQNRGVEEESGGRAEDEKNNLNWWQLCRESLEAQQYERLTINPLTVNDGITFDLHELYIPLGLVERKRQSRPENHPSDERSQLDEADDAENHLTLEEFFVRLQSTGKQRIAIVGEPGSGKTTLLQKIAAWLLAQQALPIWISLADLQEATLENYLGQDWLKQATRKINISPELQEAFVQQFQQGRVWLLLDAIDEMSLDAAVALASLARQLRGWIADAHVVLTCRLNVWDGGKNALGNFTTYCNLSLNNGNNEDQVGQFIDYWFQNKPEFAVRLREELSKPKRRSVRDAVKNPLRLALLCRSWSLAQGTLPHTKALLYQQFVETIYEWKQDRFPTTLAQRQQLNRALGQAALRALLQPEIRFRLPHSFTQTVFAESLELLTLALQLGWFNQVGVSTTAGEKVYAFYHPTFQEYFAAQAISDWQFFFDPSHNFPIFSPYWREVILLWLGRTDVPKSGKESFIEALITFNDNCGGYYTHRAYFLAAAGLAEFPQCSQTEKVLSQLLRWRFGSVPTPLCEGARVALLQTDRQSAISALEQFIQTAENPFTRWQAAYTLGRIFDSGSSLAVATLLQLIDTLQSEALRLRVIESLNKIAPNNLVVTHHLEQILDSTQQDSICRRAAYCLGKINPTHPKAIATLEHILHATTDSTLRLQTAENLIAIVPENALAIAALKAIPKKSEKTSQKYRLRATKTQNLSQLVQILEQQLALAKDAAQQQRIAYRLGTLKPGHSRAIDSLLQILLSEDTLTLHKRVVEDLKEISLEHQMADIVVRLRVRVANSTSCPQNKPMRLHECHKLLWHCAQRLTYADFAAAWNNHG